MKTEEKRPVLDIPYTPAARVMEAIGGGLVLAVIGFSIAVYKRLPDRIPAHFNMNGDVDRWGERWEIAFLPLVLTAVWVLLTWLSRRPHTFNYLTRITEENAFSQYSAMLRLLRVVKIETGLLFGLIQYHMYALAIGQNGVPGWLIGVSVAVLPVVTISFLAMGASDGPAKR